MIFLFNTFVSAPPRVFKGREGIVKSNSLLKFCQTCCIFNRKKLSLHCFQDFLFKMLFYIYLSHFFQQGQGSLREKCPYSEFFWPVFSRIRTEYGELLCISLYSVRMREDTDQKTSYTDIFAHVYF